MTFKSVKKRLVGTWNIYEYKTNGIDSLYLFDSTIYKKYVDIYDSKPGDGVGGDMVHIGDVYGQVFRE